VYKQNSGNILYNSINGVDNTVAGDNIEGGNIGLAGSALDLDELAAVGGDRLATGGLERGLARGDVLALEGSSWNDVTEEDSCQSFFVSKESVQSLSGNLVKSRVGGCKDGEGSLAGEGVNEFGGLDSGQQGGELGRGDNKLSNVLGGSLFNNDRGGVMNRSRMMGGHRDLMVDTVVGCCVVGCYVVDWCYVVHGVLGVCGVNLVLCLEGRTGSVVNLAVGLCGGYAMVVSLV